MKYINEFRDQYQAKAIADCIVREAESSRQYRIMEFCGGHTHAIFRYGIQDLLPSNVEFIHGPGCPVCVLPIARLDEALQLAERENIILCTYGDMLRVPGSKRRSLLQAKADGADIRMVYSTQDALHVARENPGKEVVFFAIGFETTTPATAVAILQAQKEGLRNFSVHCNHVLTPAALSAILDAETPIAVDAFLGPSHVSTIIGSAAYKPFAEKYRKPIVIAGFEPLDVIQSTLMNIRLLNENRFIVENEYSRAVSKQGNLKAQELVERVFELRNSFEWRGLGSIANSALQIRADFAHLDAENKFDIRVHSGTDNHSCECASILRGQKKPLDCRLFAHYCNPENPMGSCMVSSEGACAAYYSYGRFRGAA